MPKFIVTFGFGQPHEGKYVEVHASGRSEVVEKMRHHFANKYSMIYDSEDAAGVERFGLQKLDTMGAPSKASQ